jgi:hypothetical protein
VRCEFRLRIKESMVIEVTYGNEERMKVLNRYIWLAQRQGLLEINLQLSPVSRRPDICDEALLNLAMISKQRCLR